MKPSLFLVAALMATAPLTKAAATQTPTTAVPPQTEVVYVAPEKFTDVRDSYTGTDSGRDAILDELRTYMQDEGRRFVPAGDRLMISVTDVDLAGEYEPWRGPRWDDVRIVKDIYPPRINLSYRLTDAAGNVIKEAKCQLRDLAFMMRITTTFQNDPLSHEKTLLDDWFRSEFRDVAKR